MPITTTLKPKNNSAASYYPVSANSANNKYDWDSVVGFFIKSLHGIELHKQIKSLNDFEQICKNTISNQLLGEPFWPVIEQMYFRELNVYNISPEMQVLKTLDEESSSAGDERLTNLFVTLKGNFELQHLVKGQPNFLEQKIKDVFDSPLVCTDKTKKPTNSVQVYLPFLSEHIKHDLTFLTQYPEYFLQNVKSFLKLYGFLYSAQLALNIKSWLAEPDVKPCYFILDSEKASAERTSLKLHGHKQVLESSRLIFPYLALTDHLQENKVDIKPLWQLVQNYEESDVEALNAFAEAFYEDRSLTSERKVPLSIKESISYLCELFIEQFKKGSSRETAFSNFAKAAEETFISPFVQARGRAGSFFVLNQDYLLLLTNLAIGENDSLRLNELLAQFKSRGVYFDKDSEQCLIELFERMGNVERMSDSGDAVYVRKTI
ncbi:DNA phosphorothioation-dependent restriction protein DptG [Pseudoalteromonas xiamenensis]|uniref:DNA phosphorothioation-dependent restriction protein DptG n=1 Tax=Pseudoalteromonas xiamenensis TaxID=882626 RepID=UPI0035E70540